MNIYTQDTNFSTKYTAFEITLQEHGKHRLYTVYIKHNIFKYINVILRKKKELLEHIHYVGQIKEVYEMTFGKGCQG